MNYEYRYYYNASTIKMYTSARVHKIIIKQVKRSSFSYISKIYINIYIYYL